MRVLFLARRLLYTQITKLSPRSAIPEGDKLRLTPKFVHVRTCIGRLDSKPSGLDFSAAYLDILPRGVGLANNELPVILYLTGYIGSHKPIRQFLLKLSDRTGCRVVAPLWPVLCEDTKGYTGDDNELFGHTPSEYAEFAVDFMTAAKILPQKQQLASIVAHSGGSNVGLLLAAKPRGLAKSLALICPNAPRPISKFGYEWIHRFVAKTWDVPATRPLLRHVIQAGINMTPLRGFLTGEGAAAMALATMRIDGKEVIKAAKTLLQRQMPLLVVYSDGDEWIPMSETMSLVDSIELHPDSKKGRWATERYSVVSAGHVEKVQPNCQENNQLENENNNNSNIFLPRHAVRLVNGGTHWPQRTCPDLMLDQIVNLLKHS